MPFLKSSEQSSLSQSNEEEFSSFNDIIWVVGPEHQKVYPDLKEKIQFFGIIL